MVNFRLGTLSAAAGTVRFTAAAVFAAGVLCAAFFATTLFDGVAFFGFWGTALLTTSLQRVYGSLSKSRPMAFQ